MSKHELVAVEAFELNGETIKTGTVLATVEAEIAAWVALDLYRAGRLAIRDATDAPAAVSTAPAEDGGALDANEGGSVVADAAAAAPVVGDGEALESLGDASSGLTEATAASDTAQQPGELTTETPGELASEPTPDETVAQAAVEDDAALTNDATAATAPPADVTQGDLEPEGSTTVTAPAPAPAVTTRKKAAK